MVIEAHQVLSGLLNLGQDPAGDRLGAVGGVLNHGDNLGIEVEVTVGNVVNEQVAELGDVLIGGVGAFRLGLII